MTKKEMKIVFDPEFFKSLDKVVPLDEQQDLIDEISNLFKDFDPNNPPGEILTDEQLKKQIETGNLPEYLLSQDLPNVEPTKH